MVTSTIQTTKTVALSTLQLTGIITGSAVVGVGVGYAAHAIISRPKVQEKIKTTSEDVKGFFKNLTSKFHK